MDTTYIFFSFILIILQWNSCMGQLNLDPSFQMQEPIVPADFRQMRPFPGNPQFRAPNRNWVSASSSPLLHTTIEPKAALADSETKQDGKKYNLTELVKAFSDMSEDGDDNTEQRSSARDYGYPAYGAPQPYGYGYGPRPNYGPAPYLPPPPSYHESYAPPPPVHHTASKISLLKPALDLVKPVTTKVASKVSGLIGLVLALLTGSTPDDLELKGFKDIVINGIVKPLMLAKGGIKSLISKLAIPVISLLLINLEVLITIWWLWEECPEPVYAPPYQKPSYNYNNY